MSKINENYLKLQRNYLFATVSKKVEEFKIRNPNKKLINLGIGDVTQPLPKVVVDAMKKACEEMQEKSTFRGYGPELGYDFLKEKIVKYDYLSKGIIFENDEVFISDGINSDICNISEIFDVSNKVAIPDPVYPAYLDTNVIAGRSGEFNITNYEKIIYLVANNTNNFKPEIPKTKVDLIYLCYPNNPTGTVLTKDELKEWIDYAKQNKTIILYDSAYEAYIVNENIPHSIYEIDGAKEVAIEFKSFSKSAGFTGVRCAYTIVPKELYGYTKNGEMISLNKLWSRRQNTKFNGVSYITQRGAEATFLEDAKKEICKNIQYYLKNANIIKSGLNEAGFNAYGAVNSPYIWLKVPSGQNSWQFFDELLEKANVVGLPGSGFGPSGEGYFRLTGFGDYEQTIEAIDRIKNEYT
jgi:LL-diaminopimelate aminotransferase